MNRFVLSVLVSVSLSLVTGCNTTPKKWLNEEQSQEFGKRFRHLYENTWGTDIEAPAAPQSGPLGYQPISISGPSAVLVTGSTGDVTWSVAGTGYNSRASILYTQSETGGNTDLAADVFNQIGDDPSFKLEVWKGPYEDPTEYGELDVSVRVDPPRNLEKLANGGIQGVYQVLDDLDAKKLFGTVFAKSFFAIRVRVTNEFAFPVRVDAGSIQLTVFYATKQQSLDAENTACTPPAADTNNDGMCTIDDLLDESVLVTVDDQDYLVWNGSRIPMNFTQVVNTMKFNQRNDWRSVTKDALVAAGTLAAGATAFGGLSSGTYPLAVAYGGGVVIPIASELLLRELVENIAFLDATVLHDSITVPAKAAEERFVFFPRGDITGLWGLEQPVRIMYIEEADVDLRGSVILDQQTVASKDE